MALEEIDISVDDERTARDSDIFIWGTNYLKAGEDLFSIIGPLTVHYLLKELGVTPKPIKDEEGGADYQVPCFRIRIQGQEIFSFFMPADRLLNLVYVFRLQPGKEEAYQRFISKSRIFGKKDDPGITEFINNGGFFKNTVVCSFERPVVFTRRPSGQLLQNPDIDFGILSIPKLYGTVWVIDGQHRIYGYAGADINKKITPLGVVAYQDLEKRLQARDFIDINQKQKSVDPNTLWDLLAETDPNSLQGAITKAAKSLNNTGLFKNKIFIPGKSRAKKSSYPLKLANICTGLFDRGLLRNEPYTLYKPTPDVSDSNRYPDSVIDYPTKVLNQYFSLIWDIAEDSREWRTGFVLNNNGLNVLLRVLVEVLKFLKGDWDKNTTRSLLQEPINKYFTENYERIKEIRLLTSSEAGRGKIALEIIKKIHESEPSFASQFINEADKRAKAEYEKSEPYQVLKELETRMREFIAESLQKVTRNWWKERIPSDITERAKSNHEKNESPWPWVTSEEKPLIHYIDFAHYTKIIQRKDNWEQVFQTVFKDKEVISSKLKELESIRNNIAHSRNLSAQEATVLRIYADQINKAIEQSKRLAPPLS